jgi:hypothetical protein
MLKRERFLSLPGTFKPHFIPYFIACPKPGIIFPTLCIVVCFMLNELWWEIVVRFVDIGGITDHYWIVYIMNKLSSHTSTSSDHISRNLSLFSILISSNNILCNKANIDLYSVSYCKTITLNKWDWRRTEHGFDAEIIADITTLK